MLTPDRLKIINDALAKHGAISIAFLMAKLKVSYGEAKAIMQAYST